MVESFFFFGAGGLFAGKKDVRILCTWPADTRSTLTSVFSSRG